MTVHAQARSADQPRKARNHIESADVKLPAPEDI